MKPISKSQFNLSLQCEKAFYLYRFNKGLLTYSAAQEQRFSQGTSFGEYMQQRFPEGIDVSKVATSFPKRIALTKELIAKAEAPIYEATLTAEIDDISLLCMIDILVPNNGTWDIYEVKSSTSVKDEYYLDAGFQHFVAKAGGLNIASVNIIHLNNKYVRSGAIDITQLGVIADITAQVEAEQPTILAALPTLRDIDDQPFAPDVRIGTQCFAPYDCGFIAHCWKDVKTERTVFDYFSTAKAFEIYNQGFETIDDVPANYPLATKDAFRLQHAQDYSPFFDHQKVAAFLNDISYPLYYMDFETMMPAIPLFDHSRPYQQIPFQYSVHVQQSANNTLEHFEFLAEADGNDPRLPFIENLLRVIGTSGSVVVYNAAFEKARLNELAVLFPQFTAAIAQVLARIVDLYTPFRDMMVYYPAMKGSASIKAVLPALIPELSYNGLAIGNGTEAMETFLLMMQGAITGQEAQEKRKALLAYCKLDTLAMVELLNWLKNQLITPLY